MNFTQRVAIIPPAHHLDEWTRKLLEPHLPRQKGLWSGQAKDNGFFLNAVFWILRIGAPKRDLPHDYED